jgi:hypothetical protein
LTIESGLHGFGAIGFRNPTEQKGLATRQACGNDEQEDSQRFSQDDLGLQSPTSRISVTRKGL